MFKECLDKNGLFYYLGTVQGKERWKNPSACLLPVMVVACADLVCIKGVEWASAFNNNIERKKIREILTEKLVFCFEAEM